MRARFLDLKTGDVEEEPGISLFDLTENNWSCDCNRGRAFWYAQSAGNLCRSERYILIHAEPEPGDDLKDMPLTDILQEANAEYYINLKRARAFLEAFGGDDE